MNEPPRVVLIVSRDRPELYEYLCRGFKDVDSVDIVLDRRITEPTGELSAAELAERRWQPDVYDEMALRGFVVARLP